MTNENDAANIRPVTRSLLESIWLNTELTPAARVDFGIDSPEHYEALQEAVRSGEINAEQLDAAMGDGAKLTALVNSVGSYPYDIVFHTSWDVLSGRDLAAVQSVEPPKEASPQRRQKRHERDKEQER